MNFSNLVSTKWFKDYANWLPIVQWTGWVIVVVLLAKMFWVWLLYFTAPTEFKPIQVAASPSANRSQNTDVSGILNINLFGALTKAPEKTVEIAEPEKVTRLNLKLRGIYAADTVPKANAIIEDGRGKQAVYFIDEKLNVSGRVYLRQVFVDRVVLENNGQRELLSLEKEEMPIQTVKSSTKKGERKSPGKKVDDKRKNARLSKKLNNYRQKMLSDPKSVADVISGRPHFVNGELQGFRIQAGKDKRLFQELGLRTGDVVTTINGVALTNMQDAMTLMNDAQSMQELNVEIQRGNEQLSLLLNLNEKVGL